MSNKLDNEFGFDTRAIRVGHERTAQGEHCEPIFPTSSFVFKSAKHAAARFSGEEQGNIYSRFTNPTVDAFEKRLASLEGGSRCVATASGMSAILATCLGLLKAGDHIVSSQSIFGTTVLLFNNYMAKFGVETTFVPLTDLTAWEHAIQPNTKILFLETPSNPLTEIGDLKELAKLAKNFGCILVVDNCFCTPALQQPLQLGADVVIHSATKYLDGQGRCIGGAVVANKDELIKDIYGVLRTTGPTMSPFNAWIFLKGLETLKIRMKAHCSNANKIAQWLENHQKIDKVYYAGLESHPQHKLAASQQQGFGGVLSFEIAGGQKQAWDFVDATRMISITANLGDAKTTITHPATTTHGRLTIEERHVAGISDSLLRVAVGLEDVDDILEDLSRGFNAIG